MFDFVGDRNVEMDTFITRRLALVAVVALVITTGCKSKDKGLASMINMADPTTCLLYTSDAADE